MKNKDHRSGWVYVVDGGNGLYKVGCAIDAEDRFRNLQIGSPVILHLLHVFRAEDMYRVEHQLHTLFRKYRKHGEWFSLPNKHLNFLLEVEDFELDDSRKRQVAFSKLSEQEINGGVIKNNGPSQAQETSDGIWMPANDFPPNIPKKLFDKFVDCDSNYRVLARELKVNPAHVHNLFTDGKEPRDKKIRKRLFLPARIKENLPAWVIEATNNLASLEEKKLGPRPKGKRAT